MLNRRTIIGAITASALQPPWAFHSARATPNGSISRVSAGRAIRADSLVDFIAVQTQLNWRHTVWDQSTWRPLLGDLGIRYVRSHFGSPIARDHLVALNDSYGIKACATMKAINDDGTFKLDATLEDLAFLRDEVGSDRIFSIEGPNEYTSKHKHGDWAGRLTEYQKFLYEKVKADKALAAHDVLAPTIWQRKIEDYEALSQLSAYADCGNLHLYNGGRRPGIFNRDGSEQPIDQAIEDAQLVTPGKPICVTETGFQVADEAEPTHWALPPDIVAEYTLRNLAELFLRRDRVKWVSVYALIDNREEYDFGLLRSDLTPRPAYFALRNLIGLCADPGPAFEPDALSCEILTNGSGLGWFLLQKRDRRFVLALWQIASSYDRLRAEAITNSPQPLGLDFGDRKIESLRLFTPGLTDLAQKELKGVKSAEIQVPGQMLMLEIVL